MIVRILFKCFMLFDFLIVLWIILVCFGVLFCMVYSSGKVGLFCQIIINVFVYFFFVEMIEINLFLLYLFDINLVIEEFIVELYIKIDRILFFSINK